MVFTLWRWRKPPPSYWRYCTGWNLTHFCWWMSTVFCCRRHSRDSPSLRQAASMAERSSSSLRKRELCMLCVTNFCTNTTRSKVVIFCDQMQYKYQKIWSQSLLNLTRGFPVGHGRVRNELEAVRPLDLDGGQRNVDAGWDETRAVDKIRVTRFRNFSSGRICKKIWSLFSPVWEQFDDLRGRRPFRRRFGPTTFEQGFPKKRQKRFSFFETKTFFIWAGFLQSERVFVSRENMVFLPRAKYHVHSCQELYKGTFNRTLHLWKIS